MVAVLRIFARSAFGDLLLERPKSRQKVAPRWGALPRHSAKVLRWMKEHFCPTGDSELLNGGAERTVRCAANVAPQMVDLWCCDLSCMDELFVGSWCGCWVWFSAIQYLGWFNFPHVRKISWMPYFEMTKSAPKISFEADFVDLSTPLFAEVGVTPYSASIRSWLSLSSPIFWATLRKAAAVWSINSVQSSYQGVLPRFISVLAQRCSATGQSPSW